MTDPRTMPLEDLHEELQEMQANNQRVATRLIAEGMPINAIHILSLRIDTLLGSILDERNRVLFEITYEQNFQSMLEDMQSDLNRAKLTYGNHGRPTSSGLIVP